MCHRTPDDVTDEGECHNIIINPKVLGDDVDPNVGITFESFDGKVFNLFREFTDHGIRD